MGAPPERHAAGSRRGQGGGGSAPAVSPREGEGRRTSCRVASNAARRRLLKPPLAEPAPPSRARPLHKRPWRRRCRRPTRSDLPLEDEGAERRGHSPPPRRCNPSPLLLRLLPPLTGNSCGLRAAELAAVLAPPQRLLIGPSSPTPSNIGQHSPSLTAPPLRIPPYARLPVTFKPWRPTSAPPLASPAGTWIGGEARRARPWRSTAYSRGLGSLTWASWPRPSP